MTNILDVTISGRFRVFVYRLYFKITVDWVKYVLPLLTGVLYISAGTVWVFGGPLWGQSGAPDLSGMVATAAGAIAFTGAIFTVIALPVTVGSSLPGGMSGDVQRRPLPWITGIVTILETGGLFLLSAVSPTRSGGVFAAILTAATFALVWTVSRVLLVSTDTYEFARRQSRYMVRSAKKQRQMISKVALIRLKHSDRNHPQLKALITMETPKHLNKLLRHQREGFRHYVKQGRAAEATEFFGAMISTVKEFWDDSEGQIGPILDIPTTVLVAVDEVLDSSAGPIRDEVASYAVDALLELSIGRKGSSVDSNEFEGMIRQRIQNWIQMTWNDDTASFPAKAVMVYVALIRQDIKLGRVELALIGLDGLQDISTKAQGELPVRANIAIPAMAGIVDILQEIVGNYTEGSDSYELLLAWAECVHSSLLATDFSTSHFVKPQAVLIPGTPLQMVGFPIQSVGLQYVLANCPEPAFLDVFNCVCGWLDPVIRESEGSDNRGVARLYVDVLDVATALAFSAYSILHERDDKSYCANEVWTSSLGLISSVSGVGPVATSERNFASSIWSFFAAACLLVDDVDKAAEWARKILELPFWMNSSQLYVPKYAVIARAFIAVSGDKNRLEDFDSSTDREEVKRRDSRRFSGSRKRAPGIMRNRLIVDNAVLDTADEWIRERFAGVDLNWPYEI